MKQTKSKTKFKNSGRIVFPIICTIVAVATVLVGVLLTLRSTSGLRKVLWDHMESVSNTAASLIKGDELEQITKADAPVLDENGKRLTPGSSKYLQIEEILTNVKSAQDNMHISYIYVVRYESGKLVFIIDPDPEMPAEYGKEVVYTPAEAIAWAGQATVENKPYTDEWGTYYTAWSPIRDSSNAVVGLVGVDFDAGQIAEQITYSVTLIVVSTLALLVFNILVFVFYSMNEKKRAQQLVEEISDLSDNLETMFNEIEGIETDEEENAPEESFDSNFTNYIHEKTIAMTHRLRKHTAYMQQQANIDFMTKTCNTRVYTAEKRKLQAEIDSGTADFAVAIFDINHLKETNDRFGHEIGDIIIQSAAEALKKTFIGKNIYRIGGDEFSVILNAITEKSVDLLFKLLDVEIENINKTISAPVPLSLAKGYSLFDPRSDKDFNSVFARADKNMYLEKAVIHQKN